MQFQVGDRVEHTFGWQGTIRTIDRLVYAGKTILYVHSDEDPNKTGWRGVEEFKGLVER